MKKESFPKLTAINIVVGQVVSIRPHPNGDKIRIAEVLYKPDNKDTSQIIFGGRHDVVNEGSLVPIAPPNKSTRVLGIKMRRRKFRGEYSFGEMCSLYELGLSAYDTDQVAILIPYKKIGVGMPIEELIKDCLTYDELWDIFQKPIHY